MRHFKSFKLLAAASIFIAILAFAGAVRNQTVSVELKTDVLGEPISPYLYGQFIEHLGRCIYDGLWAEMLEDRKFFYPIDGKTPAWTLHEPGPSTWEGEGHSYEILTRSPWLPIGGAESVEMVRENSFVGEHTPRIQRREGRRAGIYQAGLSLQRGREYTGRVVLAGEGAAAPIQVSLIWGRGASDRTILEVADLGSDYQTFDFRMVSEGETDAGRFEIATRGDGALLVGTASLMPADNFFGWRADTLELLKQLNSPIYRWPGGNFVSGYDWKDGIGNRDLRPPRKNPAWTGIESNDVGIHEFIDLCREIDAEPFVAVNTGLADVESAAGNVEYINGGIDTEMGRLRADNGHPEPFGVRWWAVGNEMYGDWQLGHLPLGEYVRKHNAVAEAIWKIDPDAELVGVGEVGQWSRTMLRDSGEHMNMISEHIYWQNRDDLVEHVQQVPRRIREIAQAHRVYRDELGGLRERDIPVALDEWNYWYGPFEYGELGVRYTLQDALGIAAGLHELFRNTDIYHMANYAQTVNVIGAIKTTPTKAEFETTGLVLKLYRQRFGTIPIEVSGVFDSLDVVAAWAHDRSGITVGVVNPSSSKIALDLRSDSAELTGKARQWVIAGPDRFASNQPGRPRQVDISHRTVSLENLVVPPLSVNLFWVETN